MSRAILDPRMNDELADFYPSLCTIQEPTEVEDDSGAIVEGWADLADHVDLSCAYAPNGGEEVKQTDQTYVVSDHTVSFNGHYPTITEKMSAVVDGVRNEILLVQSGSMDDTTRLLVRKVT